MHDRKGEDDVVLKVHVTLETAAGTRITEIRTERVMQDMFGEFSRRTAEAALVRTLECEVISPARALIRAHALKLQDQLSHRRCDAPTVPANWEDSEVIAALNCQLDSVMARTKGG